MQLVLNMSKKRAASSDLSGGLGDINPQWIGQKCGTRWWGSKMRAHRLSPAVLQPTAATEVINGAAFSIPVPASFAVPPNKAVVFELLKVVIDNPFALASYFSVAPTNGYRQTVEVQIAPPFPQPLTILGWNSPMTIGHTHFALYDKAGTGNNAAYALGQSDLIAVYDWTDETGHGVIVPSPNFQLVVDTLYTAACSPTATNVQAGCRLLYRYKLVELTEYLQMVATLGIGTF